MRRHRRKGCDGHALRIQQPLPAAPRRPPGAPHAHAALTQRAQTSAAAALRMSKSSRLVLDEPPSCSHPKPPHEFCSLVPTVPHCVGNGTSAHQNQTASQQDCSSGAERSFPRRLLVRERPESLPSLRFKVTLRVFRGSRRESLVLKAASAAREAAGESERGQLSDRYLAWRLKRLPGPQTYLVLETAGCKIAAGIQPPPPGL